MPDLDAELGQLADLRSRLRRNVHRRLDTEAELMAGLPQRLRSSVGRLIDAGQDETERAVQRARHRWDVLLQLAQADVDQLLARVISLSPQAVLDRGYAVLSDPTGAVIRRADQAEPGSRLLARVADGRFAVQVTEAL